MEFDHPRKMALDKPDKPAYIMASSGEVITRIQLEESANRCAHLMRDLGLTAGDNIAIFMENNPYFLMICSAASRSGVMYTPVSTHLTTSEIEYIVNNCGAKIFFTSSVQKDIASQLLDKMPNVIAKFMVNGIVEGYESYEDKIALYPTEPIEDEIMGVQMIYSSGTTGRPKGIKLDFEAIPYGEVIPPAQMMIGVYGFDDDTMYLSPAPLYHTAPLVFVTLTLRAGGAAVIMDKFDALESLKLIEKYKVTHSQWVPTMFIRMLKLPVEERKNIDVSSQKIAIHSAAPIPIPVKEQMIEWWGPVLFEYYSGTEGAGFCSIDSEDWLAHKGSVGKALIGDIKILDATENVLKAGETGGIYFADGTNFEYHNEPEKTKESRSSKGWLTLGDVGYIDEEGYLYLTDRVSNMIISGGVNIYPQESENILITHPDVLDAAVIGVPNDDFGEEVKGVVQLRNPDKAGEEMALELIEFCRANLAKIKCPVSIDFVNELPRTPTGKLVKRLLKDKYWKKD